METTKMDGFADDRGRLFWTSPKLLNFDYKYLTIGTMQPNSSRGGHYHKRIIEKVMVVTGKLMFMLTPLDGKTKMVVMEPGDIVDIPVNCTHKLYNNWRQEAVFVEFKSVEFDTNDPDTFS